jgi:hypothetical protein
VKLEAAFLVRPVLGSKPDNPEQQALMDAPRFNLTTELEPLGAIVSDRPDVNFVRCSAVRGDHYRTRGPAMHTSSNDKRLTTEQEAEIYREITDVIHRLRSRGKFQGSSKSTLDLAGGFFETIMRRPSGASLMQKVIKDPQGEGRRLLWTAVKRYLLDWIKVPRPKQEELRPDHQPEFLELSVQASLQSDTLGQFESRVRWIHDELKKYERGETTTEPDSELRRRQVLVFKLHMVMSLRQIAAELSMTKYQVELTVNLMTDHLKNRAAALEEN